MVYNEHLVYELRMGDTNDPYTMAHALCCPCLSGKQLELYNHHWLEPVIDLWLRHDHFGDLGLEEFIVKMGFGEKVDYDSVQHHIKQASVAAKQRLDAS